MVSCRYDGGGGGGRDDDCPAAICGLGIPARASLGFVPNHPEIVDAST